MGYACRTNFFQIFMSRYHKPELTLCLSLNHAVSCYNDIVSVVDELKSAQQCWNDTKRGKMN